MRDGEGAAVIAWRFSHYDLAVPQSREIYFSLFYPSSSRLLLASGDSPLLTKKMETTCLLLSGSIKVAPRYEHNL